LRRAYLFLLIFPFFTLSSDYRSYLFDQIHEIVFFGKGGYDWASVYSMPIWLRKLTHNKIHDFYEREKEEFEKQVSGEKMTADSNMKDIAKKLPKVDVPDFVTKRGKPKK